MAISIEPQLKNLLQHMLDANLIVKGGSIKRI